MTHIQSSSCEDMKQVYQYICLIWTHGSQQCDQNTSMHKLYYYWHMPLNKYASTLPIHVWLQCNYYLDIDSILLQITDKSNKKQHLFTMLLPWVPATNMPIKCYIYVTCVHYLICISGRSMPIYMPHMNLLPTMSPEKHYTNAANDNAAWLNRLHLAK